MKVIAVEEHMATDAFLRVAHGLDVVPGDETEIDLMRTIETPPEFRARLVDLDARLREMDALGQDMAVLSLNPPGVQPYPVADAVPLAREFNDALAAIVRRRPTRFGGLATVAPQDPVAAAAEIERAMGPLALNGIMINSHTGGRYLDEPELAPLLAAAEANRAPIYLHPRAPSMLAAYRDYGLPGAIWGYQAEAGLHAMRLILSGTLDRHPGLTVVLGHLGEGIPYWLRRIDNRHAFATRTAGAATPMPRLSLTPSEYFRRNFVITTSGIDDPDVLGLALRAVGADRIMFAIDYPYEDPAAAVAFLRDGPLTGEQRTAIAHRTAERVFGIA
ncbi:amidohydrolase family protein [Actinoallomurus rhizosphaericola]|uniref:amidohydrolase family protein n=1 Tax=Actinoallomurus rhizosphaericola TaxID=2952536 RepID=UPI0020903967|nr:amidohydrolase family protein [Actinoallomurus rhizosphaericola]MCO5994226.1 amidohydrolase family protein [Actinoallomurus rhizosphaericola]